MPDWLKDLVVQILGSTAILGGVGWLFKSRRDDRLAVEARVEAERKAELDRLRADLREEKARSEGLQAKVYSLLVDATTKAEEDAAERAMRLAMDDKKRILDEAILAALTKTTATMARGTE
jgi:hypothetical protein